VCSLTDTLELAIVVVVAARAVAIVAACTGTVT
jgi:hypothetical protein